MPRIPSPGEAGFNQTVFDGFALRVGLNLARKTGWGDELQSALTSRFPTADQATIARLYGVLQQGHYAAQQFGSGEPVVIPQSSVPLLGSGLLGASGQVLPNLDSIPIVPPTFAAEVTGNRIIAVGDVTTVDEMGEIIESWNEIVGINEDMDYEDTLDEVIREYYGNKAKSPDPNQPGLVERALGMIFRFVGRIF